MNETAYISPDTKPLRYPFLIEAPALATEISHAYNIRMEFLPAGWSRPYLDAVVRAFRLVKNAQNYMEIYSRDKGHFAWVSSLMKPNTTLVDVDDIHFPDNEQNLSKYLGPEQKFLRIAGNPLDRDNVNLLQNNTKDMKFDVIYVNGDAYYGNFLSIFDLYFDFLSPGGYLITLDAYWEGDASRKGKSQALALIDRHHPVYCIHMNEPVHRFRPPEVVGGEWGTVAIILK